MLSLEFVATVLQHLALATLAQPGRVRLHPAKGEAVGAPSVREHSCLRGWQPSWYLVLTLKHAFRLFRQQYAIDPGKIKISILFCKASRQGYHFSIALEFYLDSPPPHPTR